MPAIDRYDGPSFRVLRNALQRLPAANHPHVFVLSAKFGLIAADAAIPDYNERIRAARAVALRHQVGEVLVEHLTNQRYDQTLINLGADYLPALPLDPMTIRSMGQISYTAGGIGYRLGQLKRWLLS